MSKIGKYIRFAKNYLKLKSLPSFVLDETLDANTKGLYDSVTKTVKYKRPEKDVIFHELIHYKQHEKGWLKEKDGVFFWKKKNTKGKGYKVQYFEDYWNSPHEIQARDITKNMVEAYEKG